MKEMASSGGYIKTKIATWAKSLGTEVLKEERFEEPSFSYKLAKKLVFNKIRQALGLDRAKLFAFGAAPLASDIRQYFLTLGFPLSNVYGMSENAGPQTFTDLWIINPDKDSMREAGTSLPGTELKIVPLNPGEVEGTSELIQAKFVIEVAIYLWATSKTQKKRLRRLTQMDSFIRETSENWTPTECCTSLVE